MNIVEKISRAEEAVKVAIDRRKVDGRCHDAGLDLALEVLAEARYRLLKKEGQEEL